MKEKFWSIENNKHVPWIDSLESLWILNIASLEWSWFDNNTVDSAQEWKAIKKILSDPEKRAKLEKITTDKNVQKEFIRILWGSYIDKQTDLWPNRTFSQWIVWKSKIGQWVELSIEDKVSLMQELQGLNWSLFQWESIKKWSQKKLFDWFDAWSPFFLYAKNWIQIKKRNTIKNDEEKLQSSKQTREEITKKIEGFEKNHEIIKNQIILDKADIYAQQESKIIKENVALTSEIESIQNSMQWKIQQHFDQYSEQYKILLKHTSWANFLKKWIANDRTIFSYFSLARAFNVMGSLDYSILWSDISTELLCHQVELMDAFEEAKIKKKKIFEKKVTVYSNQYKFLKKWLKAWLVPRDVFDEYIVYTLIPSWVIKSTTKDKFPWITDERVKIWKNISSYGYSRTHWSWKELSDNIWDDKKFRKYIESVIAMGDNQALTEEVSKMAPYADIIDQIQCWIDSQRCKTPSISEVSKSELQNFSLDATSTEKEYMKQWYKLCRVNFISWEVSTLLVSEYEYTKFNMLPIHTTEKSIFLPKWGVMGPWSINLVQDYDKWYEIRDVFDHETIRKIPFSTVSLINDSRNALHAMNQNNEVMSWLSDHVDWVKTQCLPFVRSLQLVQKWWEITYKLRDDIVAQADVMKKWLVSLRENLSGSIEYAKSYLEQKLYLWEILSDEDRILKEQIDWYENMHEQIKKGGQLEKIIDEILKRENSDPETFHKFMVTQGLPMLWWLIVAVLTMVASGWMSLLVIAASTAAWIAWSRATQYVTTKIVNSLDDWPANYDNPTPEQLMARGDITAETYLKATWKEFLIWTVTSAWIIWLWRWISMWVGKFAKMPWTMWNIARALQNNQSFLNPFKHRKIDMSKPSSIWKNAWALREKISLATVQSAQEVWEEFAESFPEILLNIAWTESVDRDDENAKKKAWWLWTKCLWYAIAVSFCLHPTTTRHTFWRKYDLEMNQDKLLKIEWKILETTFTVNDQEFGDFVEDANRVYSKMWYAMERNWDQVVFVATDENGNPPHKMTFIKSDKSVDIEAAKEKIQGFDQLWVTFNERRIVDGKMTYKYNYKQDSFGDQEREDFSLQEYLEDEWYFTFYEWSTLIWTKPWWPDVSFKKKIEKKSIQESEKVLIPWAPQDIKLNQTQEYLNVLQDELGLSIKISDETSINSKDGSISLTMHNIKQFSYKVTATISMMLMSIQSHAQTVISTGTAVDKIMIWLVLLWVWSVAVYKFIKNYKKSNNFTAHEEKILDKLHDLEDAKEKWDYWKAQEVIDEIQSDTMWELPISIIEWEKINDINQKELEQSIIIKKDIDTLVKDSLWETDAHLEKNMWSDLQSVDQYNNIAQSIFQKNINSFKKKISSLQEKQQLNKELESSYLNKQIDVEIQKLQYMVQYHESLQQTVAIVSQNLKNQIINWTPLNQLTWKNKDLKEISNLQEELQNLLEKQKEITPDEFVSKLNEIDKKIKHKLEEAKKNWVVIEEVKKTIVLDGKKIELLGEWYYTWPWKILYKVNWALKEISLPKNTDVQIWISSTGKLKINISGKGSLYKDVLVISWNDLVLESSWKKLEEKILEYKYETIQVQIKQKEDINSSKSNVERTSFELKFEDLQYESDAWWTQWCKIYKHKITWEKLYLKEYAGNTDRCATEYICNKIYNSLDIQAVDTQLIKDKTWKVYAATAEIPWGIYKNINKSDKQWLKQKFNHADIKNWFVVDAWLANRDVFGLDYDNILKTETIFEKNPWGWVNIWKQQYNLVRIDAWWWLFYRWMGAHKPSFANHEVTEINTMRNPATANEAGVIFEDITNQEIKSQVYKLVIVMTNENIKKIVHDSWISNANDVINALIWRRERLKKTYLKSSIYQKTVPKQKTATKENIQLKETIKTKQTIDISVENQKVFDAISQKFMQVQESIKSGSYKLFGENIIFDDDVIDNHHLTIHKEMFLWKKVTAIRFKLTENHWKNSLHNLKKQNDVPKSNINYQFSSEATWNLNYSIPMIRFNITVSWKQIPVLIASNTSSQIAMQGEVKILIDNNLTLSKKELDMIMNSVWKKLWIRDSMKPETAESAAKLQKKKLEIRNNPKLLSPNEKISWMKDISSEYKTYMVDEKAYNVLKSKWLHSMYASITNDMDAMLNLVKSWYFLSTFTRWNKGILSKWMSSTTDFDNWWALSVFMRMQTKKTLANRSSSDKPTFVFNPRLIQRADLYCYTSDKFWSKVTWTFNQRVSPLYLTNHLNKNWYTWSNEVMFENKVWMNLLENIVSKDKVWLIKFFKTNGVFEIWWKKIEKIIITPAEYRKLAFN